ncbi:MAG: DUF6502 family protein [Myxococcota bacterium]
MGRASTKSPGPSLAPLALIRALRHLLRPLVRLLLAHRITHPFLSNLLKRVYVEVAEAELAGSSRPPTISQLSLLTGIHRKDVRRLREEPRDEYVPPPSVSLGARLVAQWMGSRPYCDARGRPRPLPRSGGTPREPSLEQLVASVSTDIRPRAVLDEWLRLGVVEIDERERVRLVVEAFVPEKGFEEKAHYFGRNLHDHIAAGTHNLSGGRPPLLERSVYYGGLGEDSVQQLAELAERLGMQALRTVNRRALALQRRDAAKTSTSRRMSFGIYFFHERESDTPREPADD